MNECHFIGRLVADPVYKIVNNVSVVNFVLAVNKKFKNSTGESVNQVQYLKFEAWDSAADVINKYCKKGTPLVIRASARNNNWEEEISGATITHYEIKFRVEHFEFLDSITGKKE